MINESKIQTFLDSVYESAEQKASVSLNEINRGKEEELKRIGAEATAAADELYKSEIAKTHAAISAEYSRRESELTSTLFAKREAIRERIFREAEQKIIAFTLTPEYRAVLLRSASEIGAIFPEGSVLYVRADDLPLAQELKNAFGKGCTVAEDPGIRLGGISATDGRRFADETLDAKLEAEKERFIQSSGLKVVEQE